MSKRLLFIGMVVLILSSAASAFTWNWFVGFPWGFSTPNTQVQGTHVNAGNIVANYGKGTTFNHNYGTVPNTQTSAVGTQSSYVSVGQYGSVTGYSPNSFGIAGSTATVSTSQFQTRW